MKCYIQLHLIFSDQSSDAKLFPLTDLKKVLRIAINVKTIGGTLCFYIANSEIIRRRDVSMQLRAHCELHPLETSLRLLLSLPSTFHEISFFIGWLTDFHELNFMLSYSKLLAIKIHSKILQYAFSRQKKIIMLLDAHISSECFINCNNQRINNNEFELIERNS